MIVTIPPSILTDPPAVAALIQHELAEHGAVTITTKSPVPAEANVLFVAAPHLTAGSRR